MKKDKKLREVKVDENGNPIENEKKKIDWKNVGVKIVIGLGAVAVGAFTFCAVGVAMAMAADASDESSGNSGSMDICSTSCENSGDSPEQETA